MTSVTVREPRTYRDFGPSDRFTAFRVAVETSDLYVKAHSSLEHETRRLVIECRTLIEDAIARRGEFVTSLVPLEEVEADAPIVTRMIRAGKRAGTGPMAGVAAAVADYVGRRLLERSPEVIIENGGDLFVKVDHPTVVGIFAGRSVFSNRVGIRVGPTAIPLGVCTSSATVGPSLSLGKADAATIVSRDAILADSVATALGNRITSAEDLPGAVEWALSIPSVDGALAILGDKIAAAGDIELVSLA